MVCIFSFYIVFLISSTKNLGFLFSIIASLTFCVLVFNCVMMKFFYFFVCTILFYFFSDFLKFIKT